MMSSSPPYFERRDLFYSSGRSLRWVKARSELLVYLRFRICQVRSLCGRMVCTRCGYIRAVRQDWLPGRNKRHV
jgi:hypothetical protein